MDMITEDTKMKADVARDALNGDFDRSGNFSRRAGQEPALSAAGLHSPWTSPLGLGTFVCQGDQLCRVARAGAAITLTPIFTLGSAAPVSFDELNNRVVFANLDTLGQIEPDGTVRLLGAPDASQPIAAADPVGGLFGGPALVAISYVNAHGEEGGLSQQVAVDVPAGGGIRLTMPAAPADAVTTRIYRNGKSGKLRWAADAPAGMPSYLIGAGKLKKTATTQFLRRMIGGSHLCVWLGRLLVARGRHLHYTDSRSYGLYDPRFNFASFPRRIMFVRGMEKGVYVGQRGDTVLWLAGANPRAWEVNGTGGSEPRSKTKLIATELLDPALKLDTQEVAIWLSANGYVLGLQSGAIIEPQSKRIRLPISAAGSLAVRDRRILSVVH